MQHLKLRQIGNSVGVILPKEKLAHLGVGTGDTLSITDTPDGIVLRPQNAAFDEAMDAAREVMQQYPNALRELAK